MTATDICPDAAEPPTFPGLDIAVVLPCYNEGMTIGAVVRGFRAALPEARIGVVLAKPGPATGAPTGPPSARAAAEAAAASEDTPASCSRCRRVGAKVMMAAGP